MMCANKYAIDNKMTVWSVHKFDSERENEIEADTCFEMT